MYINIDFIMNKLKSEINFELDFNYKCGDNVAQKLRMVKRR